MKTLRSKILLLLFPFNLFGIPQYLYAFQTEYAREVVNTLASDDFYGRGYVKNGDKKAAEFIKKEFERFGLLSFEDNYFQSFNISINTFPKQIQLSINGKKLTAGKDFLVEPGSPSVQGTFEVVELTADDILSNDKFRSKLIEIPDKFTVLLPYEIKEITELKKTESDRFNSILGFLKYGFSRNPSAGFIEFTESKLTWSGSTRVEGKASFIVSSSALSKPIQKIKVDVQNKFFENHETQNVIGYVEGERTDSVITLMAHYDHLGMMGEAIFTGANDNASGIAMLLSLAKHFSTNKPKYTIVFIAFGAEELGLIGSKYFVENPLYDLSTTKFFLNFDIAGTGDDGIQVVNGSVYRTEFDRLVQTNQEANLLPAVRIRGAACNSDHCMFDQKQIPGFYIYTRGGIQAYHDVFDRPETLPLTEFRDYYQLMIKFISEL